MNISLTPEQEQFVQSTVKNGRYSSASEVIMAGLRLLKEREILVVLNPVSSDGNQKPSYDFSYIKKTIARFDLFQKGDRCSYLSISIASLRT